MHPILGKLFARGSVKKQFYRDRFAGEFLGRVDPYRVFHYNSCGNCVRF
jgi:hypothetical protein